MNNVNNTTAQTNLKSYWLLHGFQYYDKVLQFFHVSEGYVKNTLTKEEKPSFDYVYQYKDHLGNVRVSYTQDPEVKHLIILEEAHYYPFGLQHTHYNTDLWKISRKEEQSSGGDKKSVAQFSKYASRFANPGYNYKFGGKEQQSEFGVEMYDFGARNYDPAIGRWMNVDPLAEMMRRHSPYNFGFNNPVYFIDPDGMEAVAALDDYGLDEATGNISLIKKTDDVTDTLYAGSGEGESFVKDESKGSVTVNQHADGSSVISNLSVDNAKVETVANGQDSTKERTSNITHTNNADDAFNVFKFVADNSNVEWSLHKFTIDNGSSFLYQIGTYHNGFESPRFDNQGVGTWLGGIHSHPRTRGNAADRRESLDGDLSVGRSYLRKYGGNLPYLIYFPSTGKASRIGLSNDPLRPDGVTIKNEISNYRF